MVDLACRKPKDLGLAAELWTISALAEYVATHATDVGFARLSQAGKSTVWRILDAHELKPHRVRYDLERRDAQFKRKTAEVLMVYRDVNLYRADAVHAACLRPIYTVSVDEKPGVQALTTTGADLPPVAGKHASVGRGCEYVRHGTLSSSRRWTCTPARSSPTWSRATAASSSSGCCAGSTSTIPARL